MMDHKIPKPEKISGYSLHRMVAALVDGAPALFADNGDHIVVRTAKPITNTGRRLKSPAAGDVIGFELKASVAARRGGKNIYPELHDWRTRREWLDAQGQKHGFEVLAVHVNGDRESVTASGGRTFWIDASQFTGIFKITDPEKFSQALTTGIGRVGKAFGMGMLVI
ncbi:MAG: type I-E CRISPR-associated protein Cas6/Cse3/CasE [Pseudomonas sp.]